MLTERKRKEIIKKFAKEVLKYQYYFELWGNSTSLDSAKGGIRAFEPIPCCFIPGSKNDVGYEPFIGVAESEEEAYEIMKLEATEERCKLGLPEISKYGEYWIVYD